MRSGRECGCLHSRVGATALCLRHGEVAATRCIAAVVLPTGEEGACVISRVQWDPGVVAQAQNACVFLEPHFMALFFEFRGVDEVATGTWNEQ